MTYKQYVPKPGSDIYDIAADLFSLALHGEFYSYCYNGVILYSDKMSMDYLFSKVWGISYVDYVEQQSKTNISQQEPITLADQLNAATQYVAASSQELWQKWVKQAQGNSQAEQLLLYTARILKELSIGKFDTAAYLLEIITGPIAVRQQVLEYVLNLSLYGESFRAYLKGIRDLQHKEKVNTTSYFE